ncbi:uncharacterized protein LOC113793182 [Dermatophagoides pteronyssinus]|uniref:uncharacterized protein LOC113793182 n=1 Tax=Dermatophagoides pteronyssinus TaxID=6956 RepID=UPI003F66241B
MISRRRILSRSRDELMMNGANGNGNGNQYPDNYNPYEDEEDVWYSKDKLMKDHILEILNKWEQIDDEIWAKLICMERNRRVAKAYARAPILTINGTDDGFDGYRIGLNGFDNPLRDQKTDIIKHHIGDGVKIRMDDDGNILIKRLAKSNVYVKGWQTGNTNNNNLNNLNGNGNDSQSTTQQESSVSMEIIRNNGLLELNKAVRLFDMKRFQQNMNRELRRAYPDRRKLENQCICCISFVKDAPDLLDLPVWIMVINIVAMDMLKSKLPPAISKRQSVPNLVTLFDRQKAAIQEEDPYTLPGNNSSGSSGGSRSSGHYVSTVSSSLLQPPLSSNGSNNHNSKNNDPKPPKLPPRDFERKNKSRLLLSSTKKSSTKNQLPKDQDDENQYSIRPLNNNPRTFDDPYYSGFSARVPNFAKKSSNNNNNNNHVSSSSLMATTNMTIPFKSAYNQSDFHSRKVPTSGFLNSYLKSPNIIHSRTASYQSYYGSLGESDPYTASSENGGGPNGDDSFNSYGNGSGDSTYGSTRIGMASTRYDLNDKYGGIVGNNGNSHYPYTQYPYQHNGKNNHQHHNHHNGGGGGGVGMPKQQSTMTPYIYRSSRNDDYYCAWDE